MLLLTAIAGLANALLVVAVNQITSLVAEGLRPTLWAAIFYVGAFAIYYQSEKWAVLRANAVIERLLRDFRAEFVDKLRRSELPVIERLGRGDLYAVAVQGTNQLSVTFPMLVENIQQGVLMSVSLIYLGTLSKPALVVFLLAVAIGIAGYQGLKRDYREILQAGTRQEAQSLEAIGDILDGAKEMRLNRSRSDSVYRSFADLSQSAEALRTRSGNNAASMAMLSGFVVYLMLAVVGFILPKYIDTQGTLIFKLLPTLLFCINPLVKIAAYAPMFMQAEVGLNAILAVERQLQSADNVSPGEARESGRKYRNFEKISYDAISFSFRDAGGEPAFTVGPLDLTVSRGETVFFVGGNGSGKSTVMRLLTGLYRMEQGRITVDDVTVAGRDIAGLREMFSVILGDFHLFDRLYGHEQADPAIVRRLIDEFGLGGKVGFADGRFTDLQLSTGQRKRLALIAALLDDRPIYVFDEWSAEQDVHFRGEFYTRILPDLKAKGKTILAVTHDDRFWHIADRVVKLDLGKIASYDTT